MFMSKDAPKKNGVDLSPFLRELYKLKDELERLIIEMEKIINEQ